jgi:hypothetical protein
MRQRILRFDIPKRIVLKALLFFLVFLSVRALELTLIWTGLFPPERAAAKLKTALQPPIGTRARGTVTV